MIRYACYDFGLTLNQYRNVSYKVPVAIRLNRRDHPEKGGSSIPVRLYIHTFSTGAGTGVSLSLVPSRGFRTRVSVPFIVQFSPSQAGQTDAMAGPALFMHPV